MLTKLRPSVVCNVCIAANTKVAVDSIQEVLYEESIGTKICDLYLCLEVV